MEYSSVDQLINSLRPSTNNIGRILLGLLFIISGVQSAMDSQGFATSIAGKGLPFPTYLAYLALAAKILGGLSVATNWYVSTGKLILILFTLATTVLFHNPMQDPSQMTNMLKNLAIIGGLLLI